MVMTIPSQLKMQSLLDLAFWSHSVQDLNMNTVKVKYLLRLAFKIPAENTEIIIR